MLILSIIVTVQGLFILVLTALLLLTNRTIRTLSEVIQGQLRINDHVGTTLANHLTMIKRLSGIT